MANTSRNIQIRGLADVLSRPGLAGSALPTHQRQDDDRALAGNNTTPQSLLREATTYANFAQAEKVYIWRARRREVTAYCIALTDWFEGPRVLQIDVDAWTGRPGQTIRVKARDNVKVAVVSLSIRDAWDNLLESGEAAQTHPGNPWWVYTTRSRVPMTPFPRVEAIARDLPGNRDSFVIS